MTIGQYGDLKQRGNFQKCISYQNGTHLLMNMLPSSLCQLTRKGEFPLYCTHHQREMSQFCQAQTFSKEDSWYIPEA